MKNGVARARARSGRSGFSLLDVMVTVVVLTIGLSGFGQALASANRATSAQNDQALAMEAARAQIEQLRAADFAQVFATYDGEPANDPGGAGTALGAGFAVAGLTPLAEGGDGLCGAIVFPTTADAPGVLREDIAAPALGMPRDLSGDHVEDALDHSADYGILPVVVRVAWRSAAGPAVLELRTMLVED